MRFIKHIIGAVLTTALIGRTSYTHTNSLR